MEVTPQFKDLTECRGLYGNDYRLDMDSIETEFAFAVTAPGQASQGSALVEAGFTHISSMNNYWSSHAGQNRELKFFWQKLKGKKNLQGDVVRVCWGIGYYPGEP